MRRAGALAMSAVRVWYVRLAFTDVTITGTVLGPGVEIYAGEGAIIVLDGVTVGRGCQIIAGPGAFLRIAAESIGAHSVIVARDYVEIAEGTLLAEMTVVRDADHDHTAKAPFVAEPHRASPVYIGPNVWLGAHATVLRGVRVGGGATVAAGAVVTRDVEPGATVAGVPGRTIRHGRETGEAGMTRRHGEGGV